MSIEYPIFMARPGTIISVFSEQGRICGYCRSLILEDGRVRFVCGFRRYTDRERRVSWGEPVEWKPVPIADVTIRIVPEKPWMKITARPQRDQNQ